MSLKKLINNLFQPAPQEPVFVRNVDLLREGSDRNKLVGGILGAPRETEYYTVARLERDGVAGLYRTGRKDPVFVPR